MKSVRGRNSVRRKRRGFLAFEWILLISLLVIGIIGGLSAVRNAILCELSDLAQCIAALNVCGCSGTCDPSICPPSDPDCCDNPWWCWSCNTP